MSVDLLTLLYIPKRVMKKIILYFKIMNQTLINQHN